MGEVLKIPIESSGLAAKELIGTILSDTEGNFDLSDYTVLGTWGTAPSVNGSGNLLLTENTSPAFPLTRSIYRNGTINMDNGLLATAKVVLTDVSQANSGIGLKLDETITGGNRNYTMRILTQTGAGTQGQVTMWFENSNSITPTASVAYLSIAQGDTLTLTAERFQNKLMFTATNDAEPTNIIKIITEFELDLATSPLAPNIYTIGLQNWRGVYEVKEFTLASRTAKNLPLAFIGDSITVGYNAGLGLSAEVGFNSSWHKKVSENLNKEYALWAGGGVSSLDIISILPDIVRAAPTNAVLQIGQNDLAAARSLSDVQDDYNTIVTTLEASGIRVFCVANIPVNSANQAALSSWILDRDRVDRSGAFTNVIDGYNTFRSTTSATTPDISSIVTSHWTLAGSNDMANIVTSALIDLVL